jgi:LmbE family N-acetylglucosaminyl deacetylase
MLRLTLGEPGKPPRRILCLGAHCDDIEIGCGGTILRWLQEDPQREIYWLVFSSNPVRKREAIKGARLFLEGAKSRKVVIRNYRDSFFPTLHRQIKMEFEKVKKEFVPDLILTHYRHDLHQDHRVICELTWNTFRNHLIMEYEIPKYDGDLGAPNVFVGLDRETCERKAKYICGSFASQRGKQWFEAETFLALQRLRGVESNAPDKYAEAFHCRKLVL